MAPREVDETTLADFMRLLNGIDAYLNAAKGVNDGR